MQPELRAGFLEEARLSSLTRITTACFRTRSSLAAVSPGRQGPYQWGLKRTARCTSETRRGGGGGPSWPRCPHCPHEAWLNYFLFLHLEDFKIFKHRTRLGQASHGSLHVCGRLVSSTCAFCS